MAFTINTWIGYTGDFKTPGNWSKGVIPTVTHVAVFDGSSQQSVTTGLDAAGTTFEQMLVKPSYRGNIGFVGNPLHISMTGTSAILVYRGAGQAYINPETTDEITVVCDASRSPQRDSLILGGLGIGAGYIRVLAVKRGRCRVVGDMAIGVAIYLLGDQSHLISEANLGAVQDPVRIVCAAGYYENHRSIAGSTRTLIVGDRSRVVQIGALPTNAHIVVIGNGTFSYNPTTAPGTNPILSLIGGTLDQSAERVDATWGTVYIGPDAVVRGGTVRGSGTWPPDLDFGDDYPGAQE